ncbi:MAG: Holliday junction resolvase RuvX [Planctomycetota bacterium]
MSAAAKGAIGIDHGARRTGFATADAARIVVTPLDPAQGGNEEVLGGIARILDERNVGHFVVGYPLRPDGTVGERAREVEAFIALLAARFPDVAIVRQDERLTTKEAEERLRDAGYHGPERKRRKDSWSAMVLLEDWIRAGEPPGIEPPERA